MATIQESKESSFVYVLDHYHDLKNNISDNILVQSHKIVKACLKDQDDWNDR